MNRNETDLKGSRTINLQIDVYKKLRDIQGKMLTANEVPSFSYIINFLIDKNKKYRQQIKEIENEGSNN
jgi:predicted CopG family antitoxin